MRQLGTASIHSYRWDLVFLHGSLLADDNPAVAALAPDAARMLDDVRTEREFYERAEEAEIVASAARVRRDSALDRTIITFGGVTRAVAAPVYDRFFGRLSPSRVAKAALDDEIAHCERILAELAAMPADDGVRTAHEPAIRDALSALTAAKSAEDAADVALMVARTRLAAFKVRIDRERVALYGQLVTLLGGDKTGASSYFRPSTRAPSGGEAAPTDPADPTPA